MLTLRDKIRAARDQGTPFRWGRTTFYWLTLSAADSRTEEPYPYQETLL